MLRTLTRQYPGRYLAEDDSVPAYYLRSQVAPSRWYGTWSFSYRPPGAGHTLTGAAAYRAAVDQHYFSLIIVNFTDTAATDGAIVSDMGNTGDYRVVAVASSTVGQYTIWAYEPLPSTGSHGRG
jgi:hypothetical protein